MKTLLTSLSFLLVVCVNGQSQWKVVDILATKQQTVWVKAMATESGSIGVFPVNYRGMGKRPNLIGKIGSYYPLGYGKRKVIFVINKK